MFNYTIKNKNEVTTEITTLWFIDENYLKLYLLKITFLNVKGIKTINKKGIDFNLKDKKVNYYIFRIDYSKRNYFKENLEKGILRQGWGVKIMKMEKLEIKRNGLMLVQKVENY